MENTTPSSNQPDFEKFSQEWESFSTSLYSSLSDKETLQSVTATRDSNFALPMIKLKRKVVTSTTALPIPTTTDSESSDGESSFVSYDSVPFTIPSSEAFEIGQPTQQEHSSSQSTTAELSPSVKRSRRRLIVKDNIKQTVLLDAKTIAKDLLEIMPCCSMECCNHVTISDILEIRKITALKPDHEIKLWMTNKLKELCVRDESGGKVFHFILLQRNVCAKFYRLAYGLKEPRWNSCIQAVLNETTPAITPRKSKKTDMADFIQQWFSKYLMNYAEHVPTRNKLRRYLPTYLRWDDVCLDIQQDYQQ